MVPELAIDRNDRSISIGNFCLRAVEPNDFKSAFCDDPLQVEDLGDIESYARFDAFNSDGMKFCAHLDIFYDENGGGSMTLTEQRDKRIPSNESRKEMRITSLPAKLILGAANLPAPRSKLTMAMLKYGKYLYDWSMKKKDSMNWIAIPSPGIQQRCNVTKNMGNDVTLSH